MSAFIYGFHPSNFYFKSETIHLLKQIISYVSLKREKNLIDVKLINNLNFKNN